MQSGQCNIQHNYKKSLVKIKISTPWTVADIIRNYGSQNNNTFEEYALKSKINRYYPNIDFNKEISEAPWAIKRNGIITINFDRDDYCLEMANCTQPNCKLLHYYDITNTNCAIIKIKRNQKYHRNQPRQINSIYQVYKADLGEKWNMNMISIQSIIIAAIITLRYNHGWQIPGNTFFRKSQELYQEENGPLLVDDTIWKLILIKRGHQLFEFRDGTVYVKVSRALIITMVCHDKLYIECSSKFCSPLAASCPKAHVPFGLLHTADKCNWKGDQKRRRCIHVVKPNLHINHKSLSWLQFYHISPKTKSLIDKMKIKPWTKEFHIKHSFLPELTTKRNDIDAGTRNTLTIRVLEPVTDSQLEKMIWCLQKYGALRKIKGWIPVVLFKIRIKHHDQMCLLCHLEKSLQQPAVVVDGSPIQLSIQKTLHYGNNAEYIVCIENVSYYVTGKRMADWFLDYFNEIVEAGIRQRIHTARRTNKHSNIPKIQNESKPTINITTPVYKAFLIDPKKKNYEIITINDHGKNIPTIIKNKQIKIVHEVTKQTNDKLWNGLNYKCKLFDVIVESQKRYASARQTTRGSPPPAPPGFHPKHQPITSPVITGKSTIIHNHYYINNYNHNYHYHLNIQSIINDRQMNNNTNINQFRRENIKQITLPERRPSSSNSQLTNDNREMNNNDNINRFKTKKNEPKKHYDHHGTCKLPKRTASSSNLQSTADNKQFHDNYNNMNRFNKEKNIKSIKHYRHHRLNQLPKITPSSSTFCQLRESQTNVYDQSSWKAKEIMTYNNHHNKLPHRNNNNVVNPNNTSICSNAPSSASKALSFSSTAVEVSSTRSTYNQYYVTNTNNQSMKPHIQNIKNRSSKRIASSSICTSHQDDNDD